MRRTATPLLLLAVIPACGGSQFGIDDVALDETGPAATTDASSEPGETSSSSADTTSSASGDGDDTSDDTSSTSSTSTTTTTTDPDPELCGDGKQDPGEQCDGGAAQACDQLGADYTWGEAACTATCTLDTSSCQTCAAPAIAPCDPESEDPFHAMELGCADLDGWGPANSVPLLARTFTSEDPDAYRVLRKYGSGLLGILPAWRPRAGERMLLIGNGRFAALDILDALLMPFGAAASGVANDNPDAEGTLPAPMRINMAGGSASNTPFVDCDGVGDCSQTLGYQWFASQFAGDIAYFDVRVEVPEGTRGYALDLALFTAHYPEYGDTFYNDMAIVWAESESYVGNIAYLMQDGAARPFSLPALDALGLMTHDGVDDPVLLGTGFDGLLGQQGGSTDWLTLHGPAAPGEALTLALAVFDLDDTSLDSALLVDNFRWRCEPCTLGGAIEAGGCGLRPASP